MITLCHLPIWSIVSLLDYCKSFLTGLPVSISMSIQIVLNTVSRMISSKYKTNPVFSFFPWLSTFDASCSERTSVCYGRFYIFWFPATSTTFLHYSPLAVSLLQPYCPTCLSGRPLLCCSFNWKALPTLSILLPPSLPLSTHSNTIYLVRPSLATLSKISPIFSINSQLYTYYHNSKLLFFCLKTYC